MRKKQNRALVRFKGFGKHTCVMGLTAFDGYQMANRKGRMELGEGTARRQGMEMPFVSHSGEMSRVKGAYICV